MTAQNRQTFHVFLASPGDMERERQAVRAFFDAYNQGQAEPRGLHFQVVDWESFASLGVGRPQALITRQTLLKYRDSLVLVIGLLGQRFGTPSGTRESGTEEELDTALALRAENDGWPEIKCFFREGWGPEGAPTDDDTLEQALSQKRKVTAFRQRLAAPGLDQSLCGSFKKSTDFPAVLEADLTRWLNEPERPWNRYGAAPPRPVEARPSEDRAATEAHLRAYLAALAADCRVLPLQLLDAGEGERKGRIGLPQIYVPPDVVRPVERLAADAEDLEARYRTLARGEGEDRRAAEAVLAQQPVAVLVGDPGSGKSALVNHLAWRLLETTAADPPPAELAGLTPIRIVLRRADVPADAQAPKAEWLWQALETDVRDRLQLSLPEAEAVDAAPAVARALRRRWASDRQGCLLLLDGLDEVPETGRRRESLVAAVGLLIASRGPHNRVLVTARPYAYAQPRWQLARVPAYVLAPFDAEQRAAFWQRWYRAARANLNLTVEAAELEAQRLTGLVEDLDHVRELAERPLLATMLVLVYQRGNRLPPGRVELYRESVDLLVSRWRSGEESAFRDFWGHRVTLPEQDLRECLAALALAAHRAQRQRAAWEGTADLSEEQVLAAFRPVLKRLGTEDLLRYLRRHAGILVAREEGRFSFPHRSFQEYLAMLGLKALGTRGHLIPEVQGDPLWWREVFLLAVAEKRTDRDVGVMLLDWLLRTPSGFPAEDLHRLAVLAGLGLLELELDHRAEGYAAERDAIRQALLELITDPSALDPVERAEAGRVLGRIGDPRRGVGVVQDPRSGLWLPDIDWLEVPAGDFLYQNGEQRKLPAFRIARYPVTHSQFQAFLDDPQGFANAEWWESLAERFEEPEEPARSEGNHPRETVSWYEAVAFCRWLSARVGLPVRLPTEWEWEKTARGTDGRKYPWGDGYRAGFANINETEGGAGPTYLGRTTAVGLYPQGASPCGALDMAGNVWEWCLNEYDEPERTGNAGEEWRVVRGGSWGGGRGFARVSYRNVRHPVGRGGGNGFRVVCVSPIPSEH